MFLLFLLVFRRGVVGTDGSAVVLLAGHVADLLEHFLHGLVLLEHRVHATDFGAGTLGHAGLAAAVQNLRFLAFLRGHGAEHGFHVNQFLFVNLIDGELVQARNQAPDVLDAAQLLDGAQLVQEIVQVEGVVENLLLQVLRLVGVPYVHFLQKDSSISTFRLPPFLNS